MLFLLFLFSDSMLFYIFFQLLLLLFSLVKLFLFCLKDEIYFLLQL